MPWPAQLTRGSGEFVVSQTFTASISGTGASDPRIKASAIRFLDQLFRETGIPVAQYLANEKSSPTMTIVIERKHPGVQKYDDDESYRLSVASDHLRLIATEPLGAIRGLETFLQLVRIGPSGFAAPAVEIDDHPRFPWRGLSFDVSRHFIPPDGIKRVIDGLAMVKLNVLHWHLSDDQGFRIESKKYPKLQEKGSDAQYYTQPEVRDIIAYARDRGVRVVPEFDIPGHSTSWFPGYPNLATGKGPYEIVRTNGVLTATMDPTKESTYRFLDGFIGEMAKLFPDQYFHIGGDEVDHKGEWSKAPHIIAFMKKHKLADFAALQAYFNKRVLKIVQSKGKRMEGWDEILHPDLPKSSVIQSWRGKKSLAQAAREGYSGILSAGYYLDLMRPAAEHYAVDPLKDETASLTPEERKRVLGGEAAMWEELATMENIDVKLWPRLAAIAERFWSPENITDIGSMYKRLDATSHWMDLEGIDHLREIRTMQARLAGTSDPSVLAQLSELASILEPMKGYSRHQGRKYSSIVPFNRLVDAIPPESDEARKFNEAVDRGDLDYARAKLIEWRANVDRVMPLLRSNALLAEDVEVARAIVEVCSLGLDKRDAAKLDDLAKPKAEMLIQIIPGVRKLVSGAASSNP